MATKVVVLVECPSCGWSGGRMPATAGDRPCFKCSKPVAVVSEPYEDVRRPAGCRRCGWSGDRPPPRLSGSCPSCRSGRTEPLLLATVQGEWWDEIAAKAAS